ncbi:MAG: ribosome biogenesis GTPase Der [Firmicutes bacterium]|nr:ribosome biogenesis GTPase Der [Bacillota bacterium]
MKIPLVAVVGRPNVGKSTFFNTLVGKRKSIVSEESGVTRDRIIDNVEWAGRTFSLVDTGGLDFDVANQWNEHIREQVDIAIAHADVVVFLTSGEDGVHPHDVDIANILRRTKKNIILAVNKLDNAEREAMMYEFFNLDIGQPFGISCTQRRGLGDLLDEIVKHFPVITKKAVDEFYDNDEDEEISSAPRIAIVGKPNAGKSSIVNKLLGTNRVMVSDIAGTTRDTVDTGFRYEGKDFVLTDTAGIRRKRSVEVQTIEHYSVIRALATIRDSDVVVLVVDATEGTTEQDVRLLGYAHENGKPSVVVVNKWDLIEKNSYTMLDFTKKLKLDLAFMSYFKAIYVSALTGQRVGELMKAVEFVIDKSKTRITTGTLNNLINGFVALNPPPMSGHKRAKILYSTQIGTAPPTFALFVNDAAIFKSQYLRYLENSLRKSIDLTGTPIKFVLRNRSEKV